MKSILIRNILLNGKNTHIRIEGNRFSEIGDSADRQPADTVIDGEGKAIISPFYNGHTHAAMTLLRGYADDMPLFEWLHNHIWVAEAKITPRDVYAGSRLAILEMIKSGTVFFSDMYWDIEETIRAAEEMGIRAAIGVTFMDRLGEEKIRRNFEFLRQWESSELVRLTVAPHAIYTVNKTLLAQCAEIARELNLVLHIHLSETEQEVRDCVSAHGTTPVRWLDSIGVLGANVVAAHAIHVDDEEIAILKERGVTLVHNPASNMKLSSGCFRTKEMLQSGCRIALGTDGCSSNNNLDMRESMKFASLLAKCSYSPETLTVQEIYQWATVNGAEAFGLNAGTIAEGKLADALLIDLNNERLVPGYHLLSDWVYAADSRCIDTVICNGRILMQNGRVENGEEIIFEARKVCEKWR
ncbi:MAG: amidohydrolase [Prevotellaceae bacterium]|jgi:5-methylthioadenosine/S-adenosylhomocysteine deaminase|nr:amidohydrolase [Prevotellaceae bacterium]